MHIESLVQNCFNCKTVVTYFLHQAIDCALLVSHLLHIMFGLFIAITCAYLVHKIFMFFPELCFIIDLKHIWIEDVDEYVGSVVLEWPFLYISLYSLIWSYIDFCVHSQFQRKPFILYKLTGVTTLFTGIFIWTTFHWRSYFRNLSIASLLNADSVAPGQSLANPC